MNTASVTPGNKARWVLLAAALAIAATFRLPALSQLPPGLSFDEAGNGIAALDVAQGNFKLMWPIGGGKEPLIAYLLQPLFWLFGPTILALRLYAALWGIGAVAATYFVAKSLFRQQESAPISAWAPPFAALGLATAFWHVAYSRIAFRAAAMPALEALCFGYLWYAFHSQRRRHFLLAGLFLGLAIYSYLPARLMPFVIILFLLGQAAVAFTTKEPVLIKQHWSHLLMMAGLALLLILPLAVFFSLNPGAISDRAAAVSIFSPAMNQGDLWGTLWRTLGLTLGTFLAVTGDPNPFGNLPGLPQLNVILAILFIVGLFYNLKRWQEPPCLFLLVWWPLMLLPGILAPEDAPHHLRLIGTAPATYTFVGLGLAYISRQLTHFILPGKPTLMALCLALLVFGFTAFQTYRQYFIEWATQVDHYMAYDLYIAELVEQMTAESDPQLAYIIPMDLRAAAEARHYALDFLYQGQVPYTYLPIDEGTTPQALTAAARDKTTLKLVRWTQDKHQAADEKDLSRFLLHTAGARLTDRALYPAYDIETYPLPGPLTTFTLPVIVDPIDVTLDDLIQIRRAVIMPELTASAEVAVGVTYARIAPTEVDYKASLRLIGPEGDLVAQIDRTLRHNWHQPTSLWPAEEVNEYYLLPVLADTPPGLHEIRVVVYHPDDLAPLTQNGLVEIRLGQVAIP